MLKVHPVKNFSKIEKNIVKKSEKNMINKGKNLLSASLFVLSILGISTINSCTKNLDKERLQKTRQIDSTLVKKDTTEKDDSNTVNITIDDSLNVIEHYIKI